MAPMLGVQVFVCPCLCVCVHVCVCAPGVSSASAGQLMGICAWSSGKQPADWANWATSASHRQLCHWSALHQRDCFSFTFSALTSRIHPLFFHPSSFNLLYHPISLQRWSRSAWKCPLVQDSRKIYLSWVIFSSFINNPLTQTSEKDVGWGWRFGQSP